jgi:hypothetical protein
MGRGSGTKLNPATFFKRSRNGGPTIIGTPARSGAKRCLGLAGVLRGQTVHAVRLHHDSRTAPRFVAADQLAKAVNLDMANWWTPTGESYLSRVKKEQILDAIGEGWIRNQEPAETNGGHLQATSPGKIPRPAGASGRIYCGD